MKWNILVLLIIGILVISACNEKSPAEESQDEKVVDGGEGEIDDLENQEGVIVEDIEEGDLDDLEELDDEPEEPIDDPEPEEDIEEPEEEEEEPEIIIPSLDRLVIDAECTGQLSISGKPTQYIKGVKVYIAEEDEELYEITSIYEQRSNWFTVEEENLDKGTYDYQIKAYLMSNELVEIGKGKFNISDCVQIINTSPADGAENISVEDDIKITFNGEMDEESVEDAISADFDYYKTWDGNTITLDPSGVLDYETEYTVDISTTAANTDEYYLESPYSFSFTTGSVPPPVIEELAKEKLQDPEDGIHMYELFVDVTDPDDHEPFTFDWKVDCGYFYVDSVDEGEETSGSEDTIEWHFNSSLEDCDDVELNVTVTNSEDASTSIAEKLFS